MKALYVHAHYDDYEFTAAGTFARWRQKLGDNFQSRILICTDGAAGHHCRTREETRRIRFAEQQASARLGGYDFDVLKLPDGTLPREGGLLVSPPLLAALWKAIRDFEPDYLFCPPLAGDLLAGIHPDHETVADAVRRTAYMVNVPHAFTPEYPADETRSRSVKTPVIVQVYDSYMAGANAFDLAFEIEEVFPLVAEMSWCHQSQIREWLPWVGRHDLEAPASLAEWTGVLRGRYERRNRELGVTSTRMMEVFRVTAWGVVPTIEQLAEDLPAWLPEHSHVDRLRRRLNIWHG